VALTVISSIADPTLLILERSEQFNYFFINFGMQMLKKKHPEHRKIK